MYGDIVENAFKILEFFLKWFWALLLVAVGVGIGIGYLIWG